MEQILKHEIILLYGCGGGFDIYAGMPLYWELLRNNKKVYLANCSFTDDLYTYTSDKCIVPIYGTEEKTKKNKTYFPEHDLAKFLNISVYAVRLMNNIQISEELNTLINDLHITCIVAIDAGHDAVLFGNEKLVGSPLEDVTTVMALKQCKDLNKNLHVEIACVSAPTEAMDFDLFLKQYKEYFKERIWIPSNQDDIKKFEMLLDSTSETTRSIPNECLLSAMKGVFESNYKNPRLKTRAEIDKFEHDDYPDVQPETSMYYFIDIDELVDCSSFYSSLERNVPITCSMIYEHLKFHQ